MAYIRKEARAEAMYDFAIYAILSPFEDKKIYISRTGQRRIRKAYTEHVNLRIRKTADVFSKALDQNVLPPIYILECSQISKQEAFRRCVAWTKYFFDHGYTQMTNDALTEYAEDLVQNTKKYYDKIKDVPIGEILQPDGGLFPEYTKRIKKESTKTTVSIYLDNEEYKKVKENAQSLGLSLGAYCKRMTVNGRILEADLRFICSYINEFSESKSLLRQILLSIYSSGKYYPADLKNIQYCIDHLTEIQEKVNNEITRTIQELRE